MLHSHFSDPALGSAAGWRFAVGVLAGLSVILVQPSVLGAEQIEFSKKPAKLDLPPTGSASPDAKPFDFLRPSSPSGGFVEPLPNPLMNKPNMSKKLFEYLDQKKNWMFVDPKEANGRTSLNEMFKVDEQSLEFNDGKPKKSVEKFLEGDEKSSSSSDGTNTVSNTNTNESSIDENKGKRAEGDTERRAAATAKGEAPKLEPGPSNSRKELSPSTTKMGNGLGGLGLGSPSKSDFGFSGLGGNNSIISKNPEGSMSLRQQQQLREDRTSRLFQSPVGGLPSTDPINLRSDSTSVPANPTLPSPSGGLVARPQLPKPASIDFGKGNLPTLGGPARSSGLEDITSRTFNISGPAATGFNPGPPASFQPKPAVLEFPKRRF